MSDVTPSTLADTPEIPHMTIINFNYDNYMFQLWGIIFAGVICNIVVKAHFGIFTPKVSWDIYYGIYLAATLDSARKGGNFLLFLNN